MREGLHMEMKKPTLGKHKKYVGSYITFISRNCNVVRCVSLLCNKIKNKTLFGLALTGKAGLCVTFQWRG